MSLCYAWVRLLLPCAYSTPLHLPLGLAGGAIGGGAALTMAAWTVAVAWSETKAGYQGWAVPKG